MANTDPLDAFFKKIDKKGNKPKKQSTLLTNTEELHKQLVSVTSATTAFKENMDFDEDDEYTNPIVKPTTDANHPIDDGQGNTIKTLANTKSKATTKLSVQDNNNNYNDEQKPGDEWEEFTPSNSEYDKLRSKLSRQINNDADENNEDMYSDDENHLNQDQIDGNENRRRDQQDKPVWKLDQVQSTSVNDLPTEKVNEQPVDESVKPATSGAYRPPQLRGGSSVTVVSGVNPRVSKKEKPNLASTDEFPTLGAGSKKK